MASTNTGVVLRSVILSLLVLATYTIWILSVLPLVQLSTAWGIHLLATHPCVYGDPISHKNTSTKIRDLEKYGLKLVWHRIKSMVVW